MSYKWPRLAALAGVLALCGLAVAAIGQAPAADVPAERRGPDAPAGAQFDSLRLVPEKPTLRPGQSVAFDLQARSRADRKWYSVTGRPGVVFKVKPDRPTPRNQAALQFVYQGKKQHVFRVGRAVPAAAHGGVVQIVGHLPIDQTKTETVSTEVRLQVPTESP